MAQSRVNRIGTIFSRVTSLLEAGAIKKANKPIWYEIYKAYPPKYEPYYDRPKSQKPIKPIFYEEDIIRAKFHNDIQFLPSTQLKAKEDSVTQIFLKLYTKHLQSDSSQTVAYKNALIEYVSIFKDKHPYLQKALKKYDIDTKSET